MSEKIRPRAFAVWFKDLKRWDVTFFQGVTWSWPPEQIVPLSQVLRRKQVLVSGVEDMTQVPIIRKISFGGVITLTQVDERKGYKGRLFWANAGDLIYSKIRAKQGSLSLVPPDLEAVAVSAEYPVYTIDTDVINPHYLALVLRSRAFLRLLTGLSHGGSTKTRIPPEEFERQEIPLPPLPVQQAIVARWEAAQADIQALRTHFLHTEGVTARLILDSLGIPPQEFRALPKAFAMNWRDLERWSGRATMLHAQQMQLEKGRYPIVLGKQCLEQVKHGCSSGPSPAPTALGVVKISAVTRGNFKPGERKYMYDLPQYRQEFDLRGGDILMCRTNGTLAYVGKSCLVKSDVPNLIFPDKVIRLRVKENILPEYLNEVLGLAAMRAQIEAAARTAVGNHAIGNQDIWNLQIPLPPLDVQREIVRQVQAQRQEMARLQEQAERKAREIKAEVEALILGAKRMEGSPTAGAG